MSEKEACPVCGRGFTNAGAMRAHLRLMKDAGHVQHRLGAPKTEPKPEPTAEPAKPVPVEPTPVQPTTTLPVPLEPKPTPEPKPVSQQEETGIQVSFEPPKVVAPLAADPKSVPSPTGEVPKVKVADVPLEPFIAGSVAAILNGFVLDPRKGDTEITVQEVGNSGFPKALELTLQKYWPDMDWNHPLLLLAASGAGLAATVQAHRAPRPKPGTEPKPQPKPEPAQEEPVQTEPTRSSPEAALYASMLQGVPA